MSRVYRGVKECKFTCMALDKVNLVRLKSGNAPSQGSIIVYEAGSTGLYNTKASGAFVDEISPLIKTSKIYNDALFLKESTQAVKYVSVQGNIISPVSQTMNLGAHNNLVFPHGAYSTQWVSANQPSAASGKVGDLWFVIS